MARSSYGAVKNAGNLGTLMFARNVVLRGLDMGKVIVVARVLPEDPEVNMDDLEKTVRAALPPDIEISKTEEEPIAFGLKALVLYLVMPEDYEGGTSVVEDKLSSISSVSQVDIVRVTRML